MVCPLCPPIKRITEWKYEDDIVAAFRCKNHPSKWLCVLKRHIDKPEKWEEMYIKGIMRGLFGKDVQLRGPVSIPQHFHLHQI